MPISLNVAAAASNAHAKPQYLPAFFDADLTGVGNERGRIRPSIDPRDADNDTFVPNVFVSSNYTDKNGDYSTKYISVAPVINNSYYTNVELCNQHEITNIPLTFTYDEDTDSVVCHDRFNEHVKAAIIATSQDYYVGYMLYPSVVALHSAPDPNGGTTPSGNKRKSTSTHVVYMAFTFVILQDVWDNVINAVRTSHNNEDLDIPVAPERDIISASGKPSKACVYNFNIDGAGIINPTSQPNTTLPDTLTVVEQYMTHQPLDVDDDAYETLCEDYNLFAIICRNAEIMSTDTISELISFIIEQTKPSMHDANGDPIGNVLNTLVGMLRFLENHQVSMSSYSKLYNYLMNQPPQYEAIMHVLCKQNLQLTLHERLAELKKLKPQLPTPTSQDTSMIPATFSNQQRAAASTLEPLVLTQAGAGTGKSTTIRARIAFLVGNGVKPEDITVISFTNVAADNIKATNPDINSVTIDKLITNTYAKNFPKQQLSTLDTLYNSLMISTNGTNITPIMDVFVKHVRSMIRGDKGAATAMANFIESNTQWVVNTLNNIGQTTLELEMIISYLTIDTLVNADVPAKFLIIDEVQDNSVFQFVYALRYAIKNHTSLFFVGDSSQTLFEFRAANPKALNTLESSGVFACYQLTTNYRSNQEILDFANINLSDIEANKIANIQLHANNLVAPTMASFNDKIKINNVCLNSPSYIGKHIANILGTHVKNYIDANLARGEKTAFIAYSRRNVIAMEEALQKMYPNETISNLVGQKTYNNTFFSKYIRMYWNEVEAVNPIDAPMTFSRQLIRHYPQFVSNPKKSIDRVRDQLANWWLESQQTITSWASAVNNGTITQTDFFNKLKEQILDYEIKRNTQNMMRTNKRNSDNRENNMNSDAKLIVSTIHGAKGLEFDNVVVLHSPQATPTEEEKRMYYVAFTRAMKSEYIITLSKQPVNKAVVDYGAILANLADRENTPFDEDEIEKYVTFSYY